MKTNNVCCRIYKEQLNLINQLPKKERAIVLLDVVNNAFNQFENQNDNQIDNQNEKGNSNQILFARVLVAIMAVLEPEPVKERPKKSQKRYNNPRQERAL